MFQMPPYAAVYSVYIMLTFILVYLATLRGDLGVTPM